MLGQIARGSIAVLRSPTVETFEEHEQASVGTAVLYLAIAAVVNAILGGLAFQLHAEERRKDAETLAELFRQGNVPSELDPVAGALAAPSLTQSIVSGLISTIVGFFLYLAIVYVVGRAFGGSGRFAELAWDTAMFYVPLAIALQAVELLATGPWVCGVLLVVFGLSVYMLYLTFQSIRAGMNLSAGRAGAAIVLILAVALAMFFSVSFLVGWMFAASQGAATALGLLGSAPTF